MDRELLRMLAELSAPQHGALTWRQMRCAGATGRQIQGLTAVGMVERTAPQVYRFFGSVDSWHQRLWIAHLSAGPDSAVSHRSAAALHMLDGFAPGHVEISVLRSRRNSTQGAVVHSTTELRRPDIVWIDELPVTSAARTIIDLAGIGASATELGNAIDSAARLGTATGEYVQRRLTKLGRTGRRGVQILDEVMLDSGGHSFLERRFLGLVRAAKLPRPLTQVVHRRGTTTVARVDFEWPEHRLIVEVNGRRGHSSDAERSKDARRRNALLRQQLLVLEFTTSQVLDDPSYVIGSIAPTFTPGKTSA
jgi:very-short-patch-repair endonuclease/predicted transcriptional regulator of viral defense system